MGLFSAIVKTAVEVTTTPIAVAKDVVTLGGAATNSERSHTEVKLRRIKEAAEDKEDDEMTEEESWLDIFG